MASQALNELRKFLIKNQVPVQDTKCICDSQNLCKYSFVEIVIRLKYTQKCMRPRITIVVIPTANVEQY